jgi:hypothetical protein
VQNVNRQTPHVQNVKVNFTYTKANVHKNAHNNITVTKQQTHVINVTKTASNVHNNPKIVPNVNQEISYSKINAKKNVPKPIFVTF